MKVPFADFNQSSVPVLPLVRQTKFNAVAKDCVRQRLYFRGLWN